MKKTKKKRSAIVPAVVFSTVIAGSALPILSGCDQLQTMTESVACQMCTSVAADFAIPFSVADLGFRD